MKRGLEKRQWLAVTLLLCVLAVEGWSYHGSWAAFGRHLERTWWQLLIILVAIVLLFHLIWLFDGKAEAPTVPKATKRGFLLEYSRWSRFLVLALWGAWFLALTMILLAPLKPMGLQIFVLVAMWIIVWPIGWMVTVVMPVFLVTDREIVEVLPKGRRRRIRFDEIERVTSGYRIRGPIRKSIVVTRGSVGCSDLAHVLLERVPRERLDCIDELEVDQARGPS